MLFGIVKSTWVFQSARPVKAAMLAIQPVKRLDIMFQSARPVKAAIDKRQAIRDAEEVSIRAAREGRDGLAPVDRIGLIRFQSARPVKAAIS